MIEEDPLDGEKAQRDIRLLLRHLLQFLVEAVVLSSLGGLIGIVLGLAGSFWITGMMNVPFVFNGTIVLIAFLFSAAVGGSSVASPPFKPLASTRSKPFGTNEIIQYLAALSSCLLFVEYGKDCYEKNVWTSASDAIVLNNKITLRRG